MTLREGPVPKKGAGGSGERNAVSLGVDGDDVEVWLQ